MMGGGYTAKAGLIQILPEGELSMRCALLVESQ